MTLWTEIHAPTSVDEIVSKDLREVLSGVSSHEMNAVLYGPKGVGKSVSARVIAYERLEDEAGLFVLNASDFFDMTKEEIAEDPRFTGFISNKRKRATSKAGLMNHVLKEVASHPTVSNEKHVMLIDNAESMRRDFQQSLRRVMERFSDTCQFVLTTRSLHALIPAIRSRCFQVPFGVLEDGEIVDVLKGIAEAEGVEFQEEALFMLAGVSQGNLRRAITLMQSVHVSMGIVEPGNVKEVLGDIGVNGFEVLFEVLGNNGVSTAFDHVDDLMIDNGYSGEEIIMGLLRSAMYFESDEMHAKAVELIGDVENDMVDSSNDGIHLNRVLSGISSL